MNRDILGNLSYGIYAIGVKGEHGPSACIASTVCQVTNASPPVVALSLSRQNYSHECLERYPLFTVSVLSGDTSGAVIGALGFTSGRHASKLENIRYKVLQEGVPVVKENACCWFLCKVTGSVKAETHTVFFAQILAGSDKSTGKPMTYAYYRDVIRGLAPKNSPLYQPQPQKSDTDGNHYLCTVCKFEYNDRDVPFEGLPERWSCPVCKAPKSAFVRK